MPKLISRGGLVALLGTAVLAAAALAAPHARDFQRTFPIASRLCARVAAGHAPRRLRGQEAQVNQACATLESAYSQSVTAVLGAQATFRSSALTVQSQRRQTCRQARISHDPAACQNADAQTRSQMAALRQARRAALRQYHASIEAARQAFWKTIHSLKGGAGIAPDRPAPSSPVPTGGQ